MILSDYLLPQIEYCIQIFKNPPQNIQDLSQLMNEHALFLSQVTAHWMWYPSDNKGDIIQRPVYGNFVDADIDDHDLYNQKLSEYNEAKAKCLFELPDAVPHDVEMIRYIDGICMHCYSLNDVVNANFKLKLTQQAKTKLYYGS